MTRAIVIKTYGDGQIASAIADGMTQKIIPLNDQEYDLLRAELARLRAKDEIRAYGDSVRWESVAGALELKYSTRPHGRLYNAVLGLWAALWLSIDSTGRRLQEMMELNAARACMEVNAHDGSAQEAKPAKLSKESERKAVRDLRQTR